MTVKRQAQLFQFLLILIAFQMPLLHTKAFAAPSAPDPAVTYANSVGKGPARYSEGYFGTGDNRLHYVEAGKGPLVILYHGFPSFWFSFFDQMERLKTRYRVVAIDGLGANLSAKPEAMEPYRIDKLVAGLDALARHLNGKKRFILIGHDWGAALSFAYALAYPDRLNAVIGLSAPPYNLFLDLVRTSPEQQARSHYMQLFRTLTLASVISSGAPERIWQQAYGGLISSGMLGKEEANLFRSALSDPRAIHGGMNWYRANLTGFADLNPSYDWPKQGQKITVPSLLLWGDADQTFVEDFLTRVEDYAPGISIVRLPGVGHWAPMERPELANAAIEKFLRCSVHPIRRRTVSKQNGIRGDGC